MTPVFIGILVYIGLSLAIGLIVSKKVHNESDYLIAGRQLGYLLATFSIFAAFAVYLLVSLREPGRA
ncbi:MAG: hypothetical protein KDB65_08950 [Calditrichaeota bacterium]|nr:hypothetical protein [Calditrichota bacterium]MCB9369014.1 hypothetical protein [Calditrichota bacterium]